MSSRARQVSLPARSEGVRELKLTGARAIQGRCPTQLGQKGCHGGRGLCSMPGSPTWPLGLRQMPFRNNPWEQCYRQVKYFGRFSLTFAFPLHEVIVVNHTVYS